MTVPRTTFFAQLDGAPGFLFKRTDGTIVFLDEATDQLTPITPANALRVDVLGEVTLANEARIADMARGGAAMIACRRRQEVA